MQASEILEKLGQLLVEAIPISIASLKIASPICCVRVAYFDTHAPTSYVALRITSQAHREKLLAEKGRDALYELWASGAAGGDDEISLPDERNPSGNQKEIRRLFENVYELLGEDSDEHMAGFQRMLQRVSRQLNTQDWSKYCQVTDDFVVAPADGSQFFGGDADYEDIVNSIPPERLERLRSRSLLGPGEDWDQRPGFQYAGAEPAAIEKEIEEARALGKAHERMIKEIEARALAMPVPERIAYWIDQVTKMANDEDSDMKRTDTAESYPLRKLGEIGKKGVIAALKLASRLIEIDDAIPHSIVYAAVSMVRGTKYVGDEIEVLLREIMQKSDPDGGGIPLNCAETLHEKFKKYPEPELGYNAEGDRIFANYDHYLQLPIGKTTSKPWWKFW